MNNPQQWRVVMDIASMGLNHWPRAHDMAIPKLPSKLEGCSWSFDGNDDHLILVTPSEDRITYRHWRAERDARGLNSPIVTGQQDMPEPECRPSDKEILAGGIAEAVGKIKHWPSGSMFLNRTPCIHGWSWKHRGGGEIEAVKDFQEHLSFGETEWRAALVSEPEFTPSDQVEWGRHGNADLDAFIAAIAGDAPDTHKRIAARMLQSFIIATQE